MSSFALSAVFITVSVFFAGAALCVLGHHLNDGDEE